MNLTLVRKQSRSFGIFGELLDHNGVFLAMTLEHAYCVDFAFYPKLPPGEYLCKRGTHQLHSGRPFETFEVESVPGHTGILFHIGNYNSDSEGCILLGKGVGIGPSATKMLTESEQAFVNFMTLQKGVDEFTLTVE